MDHDSPLSVREAFALKNCQLARSTCTRFMNAAPSASTAPTCRTALSSRLPEISSRLVTSGAIVSLLWSCKTLRRNVSQRQVAHAASRCRAPRGQTRRSGRTRTMEGVVTATIGYATTQCISTLRKRLGASQLRRGDRVIAFADCRRKERLLGVGRTKLASKWVKLEVLQNDYKPRLDTV